MIKSNIIQLDEKNALHMSLTDLLLQLIFPVIDGDGVVVSVQSMNQSLDTWEIFGMVRNIKI